MAPSLWVEEVVGLPSCTLPRPAGTKRRHGDSASSQGEQPPEEREPSSPSAADTSWSSTSTSPLGAPPPLKVIIKEEPFD